MPKRIKNNHWVINVIKIKQNLRLLRVLSRDALAEYSVTPSSTGPHLNVETHLLSKTKKKVKRRMLIKIGVEHSCQTLGSIIQNSVNKVRLLRAGGGRRGRRQKTKHQDQKVKSASCVGKGPSNCIHYRIMYCFKSQNELCILFIISGTAQSSSSLSSTLPSTTACGHSNR